MVVEDIKHKPQDTNGNSFPHEMADGSEERILKLSSSKSASCKIYLAIDVRQSVETQNRYNTGLEEVC